MVSILTNKSALQALRTLQSAQRDMRTAGDTISTGLKVRSARDNAATWQVASVMEVRASSTRIVSDGYSQALTHLGVARTSSERLVDILSLAKDITLQLPSIGEGDQQGRRAMANRFESLLDEAENVIARQEVNGISLFEGRNFHVNVSAEGDYQTVGGLEVTADTVGLDALRAKLATVVPGAGNTAAAVYSCSCCCGLIHQPVPMEALNGSTSGVTGPGGGATYDNMVNMLNYGTKWANVGAGNDITYSFNHAGSQFNTASVPAAADRYVLTAGFQSSISTALQMIGNYVNITFREVVDTGGTNEAGEDFGILRFGGNDTHNTAYAYLPTTNEAGGDVWFGTPFQGYGAATPLDWEFATIVHEVGHALGLKHPHPGTFAGSSIDTVQYSVMSYKSYVGDPMNDGYTNWYYPTTLMVADIAALQYMYGNNGSHNAGDTTHSFGAAETVFQAIWDTGGTDTLDLSNRSANLDVDMRPGQYSYVGTTVPTASTSITRTLGIAYGTIIENAVGGSGADRFLGNTANNTITGGGGNDTIDGGQGTNTVVYSGNRADYTWTTSGSGYSVTDSVNGRDGTDSIVNIRYLQFADELVDLGVQAYVPPGGTSSGSSGGGTYRGHLGEVPTWGAIDTTLTLGGMVDEALARAREAATLYGTQAQALEFYKTFADSLTDSLTLGVSSMVDADMTEASARWTAIRTQQELASQGMSIASNSPRVLLQLFN